MSFEDLDVWKRGKDAAVRACQMVERCSSRSFTDQVMRSAVSVPLNIAEGAKRNSKPELIQFLDYARGSAGELRTQIMLTRIFHTRLDKGRESPYDIALKLAINLLARHGDFIAFKSAGAWHFPDFSG
jgi:four helix bundle protein